MGLGRDRKNIPFSLQTPEQLGKHPTGAARSHPGAGGAGPTRQQMRSRGRSQTTTIAGGRGAQEEAA